MQTNDPPVWLNFWENQRNLHRLIIRVQGEIRYVYCQKKEASWQSCWHDTRMEWTLISYWMEFTAERRNIFGGFMFVASILSTFCSGSRANSSIFERELKIFRMINLNIIHVTSKKEDVTPLQQKRLLIENSITDTLKDWRPWKRRHFIA